MRLLALDPGGTTGWATIEEEEGGTFRSDEGIVSGQIGPQEHHLELYNFLDRLEPATLICERFMYQIRRHGGADMPGVELVSREYIGVAKLWCEQHYQKLILQPLSAVGKKAFWTDDKLKKVGVYKANAPHANDAVRHLLYYVTFTLKDQSWVMKLK